MLNRSQIYTLLMLRNRALNNPTDTTYSMFSRLPVELIREISKFEHDVTEFNAALHHVAFGKLEAIKAMLEEASSKQDKTKLKELLLLSGTAKTLAGLVVKHTTLLECALGSGDPEMIEMIKSYFSKFEGGEKEKARQLERYRPCIEAMQNQKPNDLTWLIDIIKRSSSEDVAAEVAPGYTYDKTYQSPLREALNKFREEKLDPKVRVITKPRMHCNYKNLIHAYDKLDAEYDNLKVGNNYNKIYLVSQQIIGFLELIELPAYERYIFANGQIDEATSGKKIKRTFKYKFGHDAFPEFDVALINSHTGVGFDSFVTIFGEEVGSRAAMRLGGGYKTYVEQKQSDLQNLCSNTQNRKHLNL